MAPRAKNDKADKKDEAGGEGDQEPLAKQSDEKVPSDAEAPDPDGKFTPSWLFQQRELARADYRDEAHVYTYQEGQTFKHASYVGEIPATSIATAEREVSRLPWGGPGQYVIWLLNRKTGQKVREKYCFVKTVVDNRQSTDAGFLGGVAVPQGGQAGLVMALAAALRPQQDALTQSLVARALDDKADLNVRISKAYDEGFTAGVGRGKALAGDAWKPRDVVDIVGSLKSLFAPGGASSTKEPGVIDLFRCALDYGLSAKQALATLVLFRGKEVFEWLKANMTTIVQEAQTDPEARALLERNGAQEWVLDFAALVEKGSI